MKILVVVDMQNDFIDGALGTPEAQAIVPKVKAKIEQYVANGDKVFYTADTHHEENYDETMEGQKLPVLHCVHGTHGWQIADGLYVPNTPLVCKTTFGLWDIGHRLEALANKEFIESIEVIGLCTDICVISNVMLIKSWFENTPIIVDSSCCAGVTPESHVNALRAMEMCQVNIVKGV
jgi:nicotinamidase-related amidase